MNNITLLIDNVISFTVVQSLFIYYYGQFQGKSRFCTVTELTELKNYSNNHSTQVAMNIITGDYIMTMNIIKRLCLLTLTVIISLFGQRSIVYHISSTCNISFIYLYYELKPDNASTIIHFHTGSHSYLLFYHHIYTTSCTYLVLTYSNRKPTAVKLFIIQMLGFRS